MEGCKSPGPGRLAGTWEQGGAGRGQSGAGRGQSGAGRGSLGADQGGMFLRACVQGAAVGQGGLHVSGSREELGMKSSAEIQRIHIFGIKR